MNFHMVPNQSEHSDYNPYGSSFQDSEYRFLSVDVLYALIYFSIDLVPNGIPFGTKSIGRK